MNESIERERSASLPRLTLARIAVRDLRNLRRVDLEPAPRFTVISGSNGHGKTALLEAIYFVATSRSFRSVKPAELVRHGERVASVKAAVFEGDGGIEREQLAAIQGKRVSVKIDGNKPTTLASYATRSPVVVFHPQELTLSSGPAAGRRMMLDRLALFDDVETAQHRARYALALRQRQHVLRRPDARPGEVEVFENLCAHHGARLTRGRRRAADALRPEVEKAFARVASPQLQLTLAYKPGGSEDEAEALAALAAARPRDAHRPTAGFGPHRDELDLALDGHPVRVVASQGQHRALTLALKAAEMASIAAARGLWPILLLDDVSSELDRDRTHALFDFLGEVRGQVLLTTTRPELIETTGIPADERRDVKLVDGALFG